MLCLEVLPASDEQGRSGARLGAPCSKDHPGAIFRTGMELAYGIAFPVTSTCDVLIAEEAAATGPAVPRGRWVLFVHLEGTRHLTRRGV